MGNKNIRTNIYRMQAHDLIMCGYQFGRLCQFVFSKQIQKVQ